MDVATGSLPHFTASARRDRPDTGHSGAVFDSRYELEMKWETKPISLRLNPMRTAVR